MNTSKPPSRSVDRRQFIKKSSLLALGTGTLVAWSQSANGQPVSPMNDINIVGPKEGYSPQIGTLVSMMNWMRNVILMPVRGMSSSDLDFFVG